MAKNIETNNSSYESILKQAGQQKKQVLRLSKTYPAFIILILLIGLSIFVWKIVGQRVESERNAAFEKATNSVISRIELKLQNNYQVLQSMRGLYDNLVQVVRDYFMLYGSVPVKTYPSIISLMYAPKITPKDVFEHVHFTQSQGLYNYKIHPAGSRNTYFPASYVVPQEKNYHISGFDFFTNPITKEAIERARDTKIVVSTPIFSFLRPDTNEFLIISPIFLKDTLKSKNSSGIFDGVVLVEINSKLFFESAIGNDVPSDTSIVFEILDKNESGKETSIFASKNIDLLKTKYSPHIKSEQTFKIADRDIKIKFTSIPNFGGRFQEVLPLLSFIISLILSFAFFGFILSSITSKSRAVDLAERMTRSQRRIVDTSQDIIAVLDLNGTWKSMNPASSVIFKKLPDELIGKKIDDLFYDDDEKSNFNKMIKSARHELTERVDYKMRNNDNELVWLSWSFTISNTDGLIYCIGRDVTLQKIAEEQALVKTKQIRLAEQFTREASESKSYFITKLSHQLRNSLTGIKGYLELLEQNVYETQEEHDSFVKDATESTDDLFTYVSDIIEIAKGTESDKDISTISLDTLVSEAKARLKEHLDNNQKVNLNTAEAAKSVTAIGNKDLFINTFVRIFRFMSVNSQNCDIQITAQENSYEKVTEIQLLSNANPLVSQMIDIYKKNKDEIIDSLKVDKNDILLNIAISASNLRILNGTVTFDTFGENDGNVVLITLPFKS